jgi:rubrerythrin
MVMEGRKFQRRIENFVCSRCGTEVVGTGYTDHCPNCLWSKHVDINPGDRASSCEGMMEPVGIEKKGSDYYICYRCVGCGFRHRVKMVPGDDFDKVVKLSQQSMR